MQNFGYAIADAATRQAILVDPAWQPDTLTRLIEENGWTLAGLAITHAHYDHTNAIESLLERFDVPVYANPAEILYAKSGASIVGSLGRTAKPTDGGETVRLGDSEIRFLHTPGHTPGSQCIQAGNDLLTGDTLFIGGCGRSDLPGGDPATLFRTLQRISHMPPELTVWPGHDYGIAPSRRLNEEKADNPYLQMGDENEFLNSI